MFWFDGAIPQAIVEAKSTQKIFLVVLDDQNEESQKMLENYADPHVEAKLAESCLAIKLLNNSEQFRQFSQIYRVTQVPCSFFIGSNGKPLGVVPGNLEKEAFLASYDKILEAHQGGVPSINLEEMPTEGLPSTSQTESPQTPASENLSLEEKVQRAKQLLESKKEQEKKEEQEKERQRRRQAQELAKAQELSSKRKYENLAQEVAKEREEARLARERILHQIALDREERMAAAQDMQLRHREPTIPAACITDASVVRIQFRLPQGAVVTHQFPADSPLQTLYDFVRTDIKPEFSNYVLATLYPRHQFSQDQMSSSLLELKLAPSANIMILPLPTLASQVVASTQGSVSQVLQFVLSPFYNFWLYLSGWLLGRPPPPPNSPAPPSSDRGEGGSSPQAVRRQGNVYRLNNQDDDEDDNNTWNGNSTQQM